MNSTLAPYLIFNGQCAEAMKFYQSVFGGKLVMSTFGEYKQDKNPADRERIIHAHLENDRLSFMASDSSSEHTVVVGDNVHLSISGTDQVQLSDFFEKLSVGGKVFMPLAKQFWGDTFGMVTDQFGVKWMVNVSQPKA